MIVAHLLDAPASLWIESDSGISSLLPSQPQGWRAQDVLLELEVADSGVHIFPQASRTPIRWGFEMGSEITPDNWAFTGKAIAYDWHTP
ncbi:MAG: hypothetical protein ACOYYS_15150 [Chloroflexota bacterium]